MPGSFTFFINQVSPSIIDIKRKISEMMRIDDFRENSVKQPLIFYS